MTNRPNVLKPFLLLAVVVAALCAATTGKAAVSDGAPCPTDPHQQITNASLSVVLGGQSTATFTIAPGCTSVQVSLVSYKAPDSIFTWDNASQQVVYDSNTAVYGEGVHTVPVNTADCYYQLDLVGGTPLTQLGPADSNNFYSRQGRLIVSSNGGTQACADMTAWVAPPAPLATPTPKVTKIKVAGKKVKDVCTNLKGIQAKTPKGYKRHGFTCTKPAPAKPKTLPYTP